MVCFNEMHKMSSRLQHEQAVKDEDKSVQLMRQTSSPTISNVY